MVTCCMRLDDRWDKKREGRVGGGGVCEMSLLQDGREKLTLSSVT